MKENDWDALSEEIKEEIGITETQAEEKPVKTITQLRAGDLREGLRFSKSCSTCKYFFYFPNPIKPWCLYPRTGAGFGGTAWLKGKKSSFMEITRALDAKGLNRTHLMLVCDKWEWCGHAKTPKALDWVRYHQLDLPEGIDQ